MKRRANVFFVCSPSARVGVSTTARLLTDYHIFTNAPVIGFETDPHEPRFAAFFPDYVQVIDVSDIKGQITLFDSLLAPDDTTKIVDVWHRSFPRFFETVRDIGFIEEAERLGIEPIILYHADASKIALEGALALHEQWPGVTMMLVHNEGASPLEPQGLELLRNYPAQGNFVVAPLPAPVAKVLDDPNLSLATFLRDPPMDMSIVVRAALKAWIGPVFTQFQSFELRQRLESSAYLQ
ncbi:MAG: hypothetical protein WAK03_09565 [Methylocystis sp.]|jgi:hypothetical protein